MAWEHNCRGNWGVEFLGTGIPVKYREAQKEIVVNSLPNAG